MKRIIFTVSPVRHLKDGAQENLLSKSLLICAIHELLGTGGKNKSGNLLYFPSYEILMDELRDYRFYKEDMLHPNEQAIQYIWERFAETFFTSSTQSLMQEVANIQRRRCVMKHHYSTIFWSLVSNPRAKEIPPAFRYTQ